MRPAALTLSEALLGTQTPRRHSASGENSRGLLASISVAMCLLASIGACLLAFRSVFVRGRPLTLATASSIRVMGQLHDNPLREFVKRSTERGACDASGAPAGFPVPWAIFLAVSAAAADAAPAARSIGIQGVTDDAMLFVCRGGPGGAAGPPEGQDEYKASLVHLAGNYPGATFEEQWRAEGTVVEVPLGALAELGLPPPDTGLIAQIKASAAFEDARKQFHRGSLDPTTTERRVELSDEAGDGADALAAEVSRATSGLQERESSARELEARRAGLRIYAFKPVRMELLRGGPDWPGGPSRHEWAWDGERGAWARPRQLVPYSRPNPA